MRIVILAIISLNEFGTRVTKRARTMHYSSWMFHRKFILSITITRFNPFQPIIHVNSIFLIRAQFRLTTREFYQPFDQPLPSPSTFLPYTRLCKLAFKRDISARRNTYRDLAVGNDSSPLLNNAPRATATTSFCNKSESVLVGEEDIFFVGWDATIEWNRFMNYNIDYRNCNTCNVR